MITKMAFRLSPEKDDLGHSWSYVPHLVEDLALHFGKGHTFVNDEYYRELTTTKVRFDSDKNINSVSIKG